MFGADKIRYLMDSKCPDIFMYKSSSVIRDEEYSIYIYLCGEIRKRLGLVNGLLNAHSTSRLKVELKCG